MNNRFIFIVALCVLSSCSTQKKTIVFTETTDKLQDSLAFELCQIYGSDQGMRAMEIKVDPEIDSINFYKIIDFIKEHGFPSERNLGANYKKAECVTLAAVAVLLHNPKRIVDSKECKDLLQNEVNKGNMPLSTLLAVIDKYYLVKRGNNYRIYMGSQFGKPCIEDREKSDSLRMAFGLAPLKYEEFKTCGN